MPLQENNSLQRGSAASAARQEELVELRRLVTRTEVRRCARCWRSGLGMSTEIGVDNGVTGPMITAL